MLNVRYDYGFLGKLFGVPRKLLSQLGGFCTSFTVEGRILKATFPAFPVPDKNPVKFWLDEEELAAFIEEQGGATPEDLTHDDITDWDAATADFLDGDDYDDIIGSVEGIIEIVDGILEDYLSSADIGVTVAEEDHTHTTADITDWGTATSQFLTDADMAGYALEDDLLDVEADVIELAEEILDINDDLDDLFTWYAKGIASSYFEVGGRIMWDGTKITQQYRTVNVTNGLISSVGAVSTTTINTVTYTPS